MLLPFLSEFHVEVHRSFSVVPQPPGHSGSGSVLDKVDTAFLPLTAGDRGRTSPTSTVSRSLQTDTPPRTAFWLHPLSLASETGRKLPIALYLHIQNDRCNFIVTWGISRGQWTTLSLQTFLTKAITQSTFTPYHHNLFAFLRSPCISLIMGMESGLPTPASGLRLQAPLPGALALGEELAGGMWSRAWALSPGNSWCHPPFSRTS